MKWHKNQPTGQVNAQLWVWNVQEGMYFCFVDHQREL